MSGSSLPATGMRSSLIVSELEVLRDPDVARFDRMSFAEPERLAAPVWFAVAVSRGELVAVSDPVFDELAPVPVLTRPDSPVPAESVFEIVESAEGSSLVVVPELMELDALVSLASCC